ncbi:hypothetical protein ACPOL_7227 (plasmid) [Acidisarcina polymorpha]|uniref:CobQ/CobB/MinD/ParA nucleotide binding domain-containing protein n=2 Tax=Acidisarcina polymorpha TaxID=2211140 RepID=A0A2Z5GC95_9BACT|nr:hypothetical protein ACPOL_7227 [Acidisarcina polymorpha]
MATLAEWYQSLGLRIEMFDMDPENKTEGSLKAFFPSAQKMPAMEERAYDRLLGVSMEADADVILADMGAAQGHRMIPWFEEFYTVMQGSGIPLRWTAIGVVDEDIASARSVLEWALELQGTVDYVVVENFAASGSVSGWRNAKLTAEVAAFREAFNPAEIRFDARREDLQQLMRTRCVTLGDVGDRKTDIAELRRAEMMLRARTYRFRAFAEFSKAQEVLLP